MLSSAMTYVYRSHAIYNDFRNQWTDSIKNQDVRVAMEMMLIVSCIIVRKMLLA
jgi:hypothetical protein